MPVAYANQQKEIVVLLHGIARSANSLTEVESALREKGYKTLAIDYPSTTLKIDELAEYLQREYLGEDFWSEANKVHFVTHSMGGLVVRSYLEKYKHKKLGRVVMLAPPNGGSEIADWLHKFWIYKWFYGPAGGELTTEKQSQIRKKVDYDLGIIAGTKEWPYWLASLVITGESDGRVSVESTKQEGMKDHLVVHGTHTFIMNKPIVNEQILHFLKNGKFK